MGKKKKSNKDSLGNRIKGYEYTSRLYLTGRMPMIIRLDGKAFHTLTKKMDKPYDVEFKELMMQTARNLVREIPGAKFAYVQSDEISILVTDYDTIQTEAWYNKGVQKIVSISAAIATYYFNSMYRELISPKKIIKPYGLFDSRCFVLPKDEVTNYMLWRQKDATRNSIQGLGQSMFSHKQLQGKSCEEIQDMLMLEKEINWNDTPTYFKRGGCVYRDLSIDLENNTVLNNQKFKLYDKLNKIDAKKIIVEENSELISIKNKIEKDIKKIEKKLENATPVNKLITDEEIPIFTKDRMYIEHIVNCDYTEALNRKRRSHASKILEDMPESKVMSDDLISKHIHDIDDDIEHVESQNKKADFTLKGLKDGLDINIKQGSIVACHLMTKHKTTAPLKVRYSNEFLCWVFGNHTMRMLKELDTDIRFSLIK